MSENESKIPGTQVAVVNKAPLHAGGAVAAFVPQTIDELWRMAQIVAVSGMAPRGLEKPETLMVAMMHGAEVGQKPFWSMKNIAVINNRPVIWGDGPVSLVRSSGVCEYIKEWTEGEGDQIVAYAETRRKGESTAEVREFSYADAKKAGVIGKAGPWTQYFKRMLMIRARSFLLRDVYADVLGGLFIKEEVEDEDTTYREPPPAIEPPPATPAATVEAVPAGDSSGGEGPRRRGRKAAGAKDPAPVAETAPSADAGPAGTTVDAADGATEVPPAHDPETGEVYEDVDSTPVDEPRKRTQDEILADLEEQASVAQTIDDLDEVWVGLLEEITEQGRKFREERAMVIFEQHEARIKTAMVAKQAAAMAPAEPPPAGSPPPAMAERPAEPPPALSPERHKEAFQAGVAAFEANRFKQVPPEYQKFSDLSEQWFKGFEQAEAAKKAADAERARVVAEKISPPKGKPTEAELDVAYNSGISMQRRGATRRALPPEYRGEDAWSTAMADQWESGWDYAKANPA